MPVIAVPLPDELARFVADQARKDGHAHPAAYVLALLTAERARIRSQRLQALLRQGAEGSAAAAHDALPGLAGLDPGQTGGTRISPAARADIQAAAARHGAQPNPAIARRFADAIAAALRLAAQSCAGPAQGLEAGPDGARAIPLKGFSGYALWCRDDGAGPVALRLLHAPRDLD